jgi:hypothetical protein
MLWDRGSIINPIVERLQEVDSIIYGTLRGRAIPVPDRSIAMLEWNLLDRANYYS